MFKVGISGDLLNSNNEPCFGDSPLNLLKDRDDIKITWMDKKITELSSEMTSIFDAILLNLPKANADCVSDSNCRLKIISRFGVGFDSVDIEAMKRKNIIVTNTPNAVRRPVAVAALTMIFASAGKLFQKDNLVRSGNWNKRTNFMGIGLSKKILGVIGAGNIGAETIKLSKPFFNDLVSFITSGPVVAMQVEGENVVLQIRNLMGATNPSESTPGSIRGDLATELDKNVVHGSDSDESAKRELELFFG